MARKVLVIGLDGATFRIDEMGSVTCNGHVGVSNTMASALWATGALFSVEGWVHSGAWVTYEPKTAKIVDTGLLAPSPVDTVMPTSRPTGCRM